MEKSMNRNKLKKALQFYTSGHPIGDIAQFIDVPRTELKNKLTELGVVDNSTALLQLREMQKEDEESNQDGGKWDKGGKEVEEFTPPETPYLGKFDKESAKKNAPKEELIPMSYHQEFRRDFKNLTWKDCSEKWTNLLRMSESNLKQQAKILAPIEYQKKFRKGK